MATPVLGRLRDLTVHRPLGTGLLGRGNRGRSRQVGLGWLQALPNLASARPITSYGKAARAKAASACRRTPPT
jgi:hypothetical protein